MSGMVNICEPLLGIVNVKELKVLTSSNQNGKAARYLGKEQPQSWTNGRRCIGGT